MEDYSVYLSPFSWRYGTPPMRGLWSERAKRALWRSIWVSLARVQARYGLVRTEQVQELELHAHEVDVPQALRLEAEIHHDLMAELKTFASQCPKAGGIIHLGATSMDIEDNADALRQREALDLLLGKLRGLLLAFAGQIEAWADAPTMAFTHLQPAEPTTVGYRLAQYAQDLWSDWLELTRVRADLRGKGFKGAVGTSASYAQLLSGDVIARSTLSGVSRRLADGVEGRDEAIPSGAGDCFGAAAPRNDRVDAFEARIMSALGLAAFPVATQTYPRKQDYRVLSALAGLGGSLYKFAFDLRVLQSPPIGEWAEPFGSRQVGSSAMPFKRNPIHAENMDSLARHLAALPRVAWDNAAHSLLERTLDDSANRRTILPEAFLAADELVARGTRLITGLRVDRDASARLLAAYGPFAATERMMMELVKAGGDRQALHEIIREHAMTAWGEVRAGRPNPLVEALCADPRITQYAPRNILHAWLDASDYVGDAPQRARDLAGMLRRHLQDGPAI